eukprot:5474635-Prorocentrum_lima.AAC.1
MECGRFARFRALPASQGSQLARFRAMLAAGVCTWKVCFRTFPALSGACGRSVRFRTFLPTSRVGS